MEASQSAERRVTVSGGQHGQSAALLVVVLSISNCQIVSSCVVSNHQRSVSTGVNSKTPGVRNWKWISMTSICR